MNVNLLVTLSRLCYSINDEILHRSYQGYRKGYSIEKDIEHLPFSLFYFLFCCIPFKYLLFPRDTKITRGITKSDRKYISNRQRQ